MTEGLPVTCIFYSTRSNHSHADYDAWAQRIEQLVTEQPGYINHHSWRDSTTGRGVTISYFTSAADIESWRNHPEHLEAQALGRQSFYDNYTVQIAQVTREYHWPNESNAQD